MATLVELCNQALNELGVAEIQAIGEDSPQGKKCEVVLPDAIKYVLAAHEWRFATLNFEPAQHSQDPPADWAFRFDYPSDVARIIKVYVAGSTRKTKPLEYTLQRLDDGTDLTLLCDTNAICLRYVTNSDTKVTSPDFTPEFQDALVWRLAWRMAMALTRSAPLRQSSRLEYNNAIAQAVVSDVNQVNEGTGPIAESLQARGITELRDTIPRV